MPDSRKRRGATLVMVALMAVGLTAAAGLAAAIRFGSKVTVNVGDLITTEPGNMNGRSQVHVSGFARFYLERVTSKGEVYGRFIERVQGRSVAGTASQYAVRLVE